MSEIRPSRLVRLGDALSQVLNVLIYNGDANESLSGRSWRCRWERHVAVIDALLGYGHCQSAFETDKERGKLMAAQERNK